MNNLYYFTISKQHVAITDAHYFNTNGYQSDWHITELNTLLEPTFSEECEGCYSTELDEQSARDFLLETGLAESDTFTEFMDTHSTIPQLDDVILANDSVTIRNKVYVPNDHWDRGAMIESKDWTDADIAEKKAELLVLCQGDDAGAEHVFKDLYRWYC